MIKRKVCVVTGTRAEYGLLHWLMKEIKDDPVLKLQTIVTGMHLSPEFGLTYKQIEKDGFHIDRKVEMLLSADTPNAISKSTGLGLIGCADAFTELKPDLIYIGGDIVHGKLDTSPEEVRMVANFFLSLCKISPTIIIPGNHDCNLNNKSREDTLSPIVDLVVRINPNLHYWKKSGVYTIDDVDFGVLSILTGDFPAVVGLTLVYSISYVLINFLIDIFYLVIDSRARY